MENRFKITVAVENHGQKRHISHSRFGDEIGDDKNRGCVLVNIGVMYVTYHQIFPLNRASTIRLWQADGIFASIY